MTGEHWQSMSAQEKNEYLAGFKAEVEVQTVMNGEARPGDDDAFLTVYTVVRGGVMTGQAYTLLEAAQQDAKPVKY